MSIFARLYNENMCILTMLVLMVEGVGLLSVIWKKLNSGIILSILFRRFIQTEYGHLMF